MAFSDLDCWIRFPIPDSFFAPGGACRFFGAPPHSFFFFTVCHAVMVLVTTIFVVVVVEHVVCRYRRPD
jgi:hypothetical protein